MSSVHFVVFLTMAFERKAALQAALPLASMFLLL
jgi:hypothetical protein